MLTEEIPINEAEAEEGSVTGDAQVLDHHPLDHSRNIIKLDMLPIEEDKPVEHVCFLSRNDKGYIIANTDDIPVLDFDFNSTWKAKFTAAEFENYLFSNIEKYTSNYRLYRTAGGYRAILTNEFVPVCKFEFFKYESIGGDPIYHMCCDRDGLYRVRLTPKPNRLSIPNLEDVFDTDWLANFKLTTDEQKESYYKWITQYAAAGKDFGVCRLVRFKSTEPTPDRINRFLEMHDSATKAHLAMHLA